ncbi:60S ribosomal protein L7-2, putative [Plasmodium ovale wallikeri]|uniref:60S ribosomal protein L7-2, putative n=1 Tax=Plasmodium ovale wallikeri TaxID=864142 RepID=A0A1A8Z0K4_PLAOA|nr:60S ribosomal protein L7-2, putative [Plasmodium ovale wallikeri]
MGKEGKTKQPEKKAGKDKRKRIKYRRILKVKYKEEKNVLLGNQTNEQDVKVSTKIFLKWFKCDHLRGLTVCVSHAEERIPRNGLPRKCPTYAGKISQRRPKLNTPYRRNEHEHKVRNQEKKFENLKNLLKEENFDEKRQCVFAMRNNVDCFCPEQKNIIKELRLGKKFSAVLLVNSVQNMKNLFLVSPFVYYGYMNKYNCYNLIEKKLFLRYEKEIKRCNSNKIIDDLFGKDGVHSLSSLCEHIFECKHNADIIMEKHIVPFDFSFLQCGFTIDFLELDCDLVGFAKDGVNEVLEKII